MRLPFGDRGRRIKFELSWAIHSASESWVFFLLAGFTQGTQHIPRQDYPGLASATGFSQSAWVSGRYLWRASERWLRQHVFFFLVLGLGVSGVLRFSWGFLGFFLEGFFEVLGFLGARAAHAGAHLGPRGHSHVDALWTPACVCLPSFSHLSNQSSLGAKSFELLICFGPPKGQERPDRFCRAQQPSQFGVLGLVTHTMQSWRWPEEASN